MLLAQNDRSNKEYLYYLIISQLYNDGYNDQATQLERHILKCDNVVPPGSNLSDMVTCSIASFNGISRFFGDLEATENENSEEDDITIELDSKHQNQLPLELIMEDKSSFPLQKKKPGRPSTCSQPSTTSCVTMATQASTTSQVTLVTSAPAVIMETASPSEILPSVTPLVSASDTISLSDTSATSSESLPRSSTSLQASLQSCVEMLNSEAVQSTSTGNATLTNDSMSEVFQIINNLTKLNNGTIKQEPYEGEPLTDGSSLEENIDKAIETLQHTLTTLKDDGLNILPNSLSGTPNMLGLSENQDFGVFDTTGDLSDGDGSLVKPFSLADKQLKCPRCDYLTFSKRAYTLHLRSHDEVSTRKGDRVSFTKHNYSGNKNVIRPYACKMCKYRAPSRIQLTLHVRTHTGEKPHPCPYCDYRTAQKGNLKKHIEFRHSNSGKSSEHCCTLCNYRASSRLQLSMHVNQSHSDTADNSDEQQEKRYQCKLCDFRCVWVGSLRSHMFDKHPESMTRRNEPAEHKCSLCDYSSQWRGNLKTHMLRKHATPEVVNGQYMCKRCDFKTQHQEELYSHYEVHVSDERPYQCHLCDYRAGLKNTLDTHMKYKHSDEKPFSCDMCSYKCVTKGQLTIHQRKHTGERPYKCPYCPYDTAQQSNLKSHVRHRHPNQNQLIFNNRRGRKRKYPYPEDDIYQMYNAVTMAYNLNHANSGNVTMVRSNNVTTVAADKNSVDEGAESTTSSAEVMVPFSG